MENGSIEVGVEDGTNVLTGAEVEDGTSALIVVVEEGRSALEGALGEVPRSCTLCDLYHGDQLCRDKMRYRRTNSQRDRRIP